MRLLSALALPRTVDYPPSCGVCCAVSEDLEAQLDALFQLPPAEMVAARNELVARLKKAGEREAAARVKGIKRPAPAAWAINQIFFREHSLLESALADVLRVRELQASDGLDRQQLSAAVAAQRLTLQALVDAALRYCATQGLPTGGTQERRIFATVQGWLGGTGAEAPGRMTEELEPSGFEGLGQLGIPSPLPAASPKPAPQLPAASPKPAAQLPAASPKPAAPLSAAGSKPASRPPLQLVPPLTAKKPDHDKHKDDGPTPEQLARRAREQAEARVREHKQAAAWAQERLKEKREKLATAEQAVERAKREVEDAERALSDRRSRLHEKEAEHTRRHSDLEDAERAHTAADKALAKARAELSKL